MTETNWQSNLIAQGAVFENGMVQHFGDAAQSIQATATTNTLCDLSHLGLLALTGDDATTFLQGQVTNDVKALDGNNAHFTGYCSPKGRLLALFFAFSHSNTLYLQFNQSLLIPIMKRLKMYVLRAKVDIQDASNSLIRFGINGPEAAKLLTQVLSTAPAENYTMAPIIIAQQSVGTMIRLPSIETHQRFEILIEADHAQDVWDKLKENCQLIGKPCWDWLDIQTGLPDIVEQTQEQFVPQMLNIDCLNGINFKKGCYTGQEIVARTHYLGKIKRRTYLATIASSQTPHAGEKVVDGDGNEVGQFVKVAPNLAGGFDALIEIRIEAKTTGHIHWNTHAVTFGQLPYRVDND
ncbi:MAG: folate-binding protein YgfZ [Methylophilaceae bacterium]|nr:MAG: folate-binding protein YgfZ [Methylophilaceae bacterium]